jgi:HEAT repeat protein
MSPSLDWLIDCLERAHAIDLDIQHAARLELQQCDPSLLRHLLMDLAGAPQPELRCEAIGVLGALFGSEATETLRKLLADPDPIVRGNACGILQDVIGTAAIPELLHAAERDIDPNVRINAIWTIGKIGTRSCIPTLETIVANDPAVDFEGRAIARAAKDAIESIVSRSP